MMTTMARFGCVLVTDQVAVMKIVASMMHEARLSVLVNGAPLIVLPMMAGTGWE
jgi:hypothetical protein